MSFEEGSVSSLTQGYGLKMDNCTVEPPIKDPLRKGQPPNEGHSSGHLSYIFNLQEEDNLSIKDKKAGPKVSFIWRFHCKAGPKRLNVKALSISILFTYMQKENKKVSAFPQLQPLPLIPNNNAGN